MTVVLSPLRQRLLALALLAVCVVLVLVLVVQPMWSASALHAERVGMLQRQVRTMQGLVEAQPRFEAAVAALAGDVRIQGLTIAAESAAVAGAQLQGQITQILAAAPAVLSSAQLLPEERVGALTRVRLQLVAEADMQGLVQALHAIGGARPLLRIETLVVRDPDGVFATRPEARLANRLQVEMVVSALVRAP
jgi:general secretion pathway protein M